MRFMGEIRRTKTEYGGFLPIELNQGREYFADYEKQLCRFNTVKAALDCLIGRLGKRSIHVPYYYCPSTIEAIKKTGIEVCFYHIDRNFMPIGLPDEDGSIVLLVDYFGVCTGRVVQFVHSFKRTEVVIDRAHAFFSAPVISRHVHNVYSAKKFFGVPDGAYLISGAMLPYVEPPTFASGYAEYLLKTYEEGTNAAYRMKKDVDNRLANNYGSMSVLSIGLLKNVDYHSVEKKRRDNYRTLREAFNAINCLALPVDSPAYQFPLLILEKGKHIKRMLVEDKIFVSTLWSGQDLKDNGNDFEIDMMENAVFLPIDQRYGSEDMEYIISCVKAGVERYGS